VGKEKRRKGDAEGDVSFMRGTISPVASNPKSWKRGKRREREEAMDDCEEQAVHVNEDHTKPRLTELPLLENDACSGSTRRRGNLAKRWRQSAVQRCSSNNIYVLFWSPHPIRKVHEHCMNGPVILFLYSTVN
jgi:hypothetical protein